MAVLDTYGTSNSSGFIALSASSSQNAVGQCLTLPTTSKVSNVQFLLLKQSAPTGNVTARIYLLTGTIGSTAKPASDSPIAESSSVAASSVPTTAGLVTFTFPSLILPAGTYCFAAYYNGTGGTVNIHNDSDVPTHGGNTAYRSVSNGLWSGLSTFDTIFVLNGTPNHTNFSGFFF